MVRSDQVYFVVFFKDSSIVDKLLQIPSPIPSLNFIRIDMNADLSAYANPKQSKFTPKSLKEHIVNCEEKVKMGIRIGNKNSNF